MLLNPFDRFDEPNADVLIYIHRLNTTGSMSPVDSGAGASQRAVLLPAWKYLLIDAVAGTVTWLAPSLQITRCTLLVYGGL
ncbi:MAG: hypothetical protein ACYDHP_09100 [Ferrimicrobium sp.]